MNDVRRRVLRSIAVTVAAVVLAAVVIYIVSYLLFPINGVRVEGTSMLPKGDVTRNIPDHTSLLTLNTRALKRNLESNPWVKGVDVARDWQSGIVTVEVEERHAILSAKVDGRKEVLAQDGAKLPGLGGANLKTIELDKDRLEEIVKAGKVLQRNGIELESIDASGPGGVRASVRGHEIVFAGEIGQDQARALGGIMKKNPRAGVFDLRSPERVVVGMPDAVPGGPSSSAPNG